MGGFFVIGIGAGLALMLPSLAHSGSDLRGHGASMLLSPGESELKLFHNLYTQTRSFDGNGGRTDAGPRSTWYTGSAALRFGWRPRINPSVEVTVRTVRDGTRLPDFASRRGLTAVMPRVQVAISRTHPSLTMETGVRVPLATDLEGDARDPFLDFADPIWMTHLLDELTIGERLRVYLEAGTHLRLAGDESQLTTPFKVIAAADLLPRWTLVVPLEVSPDWLGAAAGNYFTQVGLGAKVLTREGAELEALWTAFPMGRNAGAGQTFNLGLRLVR